MTLLDRHIEFVEALRSAGLPVSLAEGLDAVEAIDALGHRGARDPAGGVRRDPGQAPEPPPRLRPGLRPLLPGADRGGARRLSVVEEAERTAVSKPRTMVSRRSLTLAPRPARRRRSPGAGRLPRGAGDGDGDGRPRRAGDAGARGGAAVRADPGARAGRAAVVVVQRDEPGLARRARRQGAGRAARRGHRRRTRRCGGWSRRRRGRSRGWSTRRYAAARPRSAARSTWPGTPCARRSSRSTSPRRARPTSS